jgi:hypothetical protein
MAGPYASLCGPTTDRLAGRFAPGPACPTGGGAAAEAEAGAAQSAEEGRSLIHRPGEEPAEGPTEPRERIE